MTPFLKGHGDSRYQLNTNSTLRFCFPNQPSREGSERHPQARTSPAAGPETSGGTPGARLKKMDRRRVSGFVECPAPMVTAFEEGRGSICCFLFSESFGLPEQRPLTHEKARDRQRQQRSIWHFISYCSGIMGDNAGTHAQTSHFTVNATY